MEEKTIRQVAKVVVDELRKADKNEYVTIAEWQASQANLSSESGKVANSVAGLHGSIDNYVKDQKRVVKDFGKSLLKMNERLVRHEGKLNGMREEEVSQTKMLTLKSLRRREYFKIASLVLSAAAALVARVIYIESIKPDHIQIAQTVVEMLENNGKVKTVGKP
jgi:hypothetical protein